MMIHSVTFTSSVGVTILNIKAEEALSFYCNYHLHKLQLRSMQRLQTLRCTAHGNHKLEKLKVLDTWSIHFIPVLGLVLGAPVPGSLAILVGTLIPLGLAVLMLPPPLTGWTHKASVRQRVQTDPRPSTQLGAALRW